MLPSIKLSKDLNSTIENIIGLCNQELISNVNKHNCRVACTVESITNLYKITKGKQEVVINNHNFLLDHTKVYKDDDNNIVLIFEFIGNYPQDETIQAN